MEIAFSLKRHASNYSTLHRSDIAARAAPLDLRLMVSGDFLKDIFEKIYCHILGQQFV